MLHSLRNPALWLKTLLVFAGVFAFIENEENPNPNPNAHAAEPQRAVLFLGDGGHHRPAAFADILTPYLAKSGIAVTYTDRVQDLTPENLRRYRSVLLYANHAKISAEQERALLDFVEAGGGFVPVHCASACFGHSDRFIALVGGQFKRHTTGVFRPKVVDAQHTITRGFEEFEAWDETYEHTRLAEDRHVLMVREGAGRQEPWTWTRNQGKGRVFYTASGHDARCWLTPGFLNLIERGLHWSMGEDPASARRPDAVEIAALVARREQLATNINKTAKPKADAFERPRMTPFAKDAKPFEYVEAKVAFYPPGGARKGDGGWNKMQLPLDARESMKHLSVPEGFRVELFAAEPDIGKPIAMAWDERGRLWLAETVDYPNELQPAGEGRDRIRICEDTDGDGRADKFTVFAEKLSIPTSLVVSQGGVIVHQAPHTLFLKDTTGDDVADVRKVLFTGWSTDDTHAGPNNLQYGLDNWIYGMVGYAGFRGEIGGQAHTFKQGFYRFRPDGSKLEFLRSTNNNTWGIGFSEEGLVFGSTANGNPSTYMPIPNRVYEQVRGWSAAQLGTIADHSHFHAATEKLRQVDHHGGYTAAAGHALYTARVYPKDYWNRTAFVTEPTGHLIGTFVLDGQGSDFRARNPFNLLASDDEWSAPIMAEVGPDGNVWAIDWYNYIVQHNPTPVGFERGKGNAYETNLRDKKHGRIYRLVYNDGKADAPLDLSKADEKTLVATLKHPNLLLRKHAQRLLVERGKLDIVPALWELTRDRSVDAIGLNVGAIHALWTLEGLGQFAAPNEQEWVNVAAALAHPSAGVRRAAAMVLPRVDAQAATRAILDRKVLDDANPHVRLTALLAIADLSAGTNDASGALVKMFERPENANDRWIADALTAAAARNGVAFLTEAAAVKRASPKLLVSVEIVAEHLARGDDPNFITPLLTVLARAEPATIESTLNGLVRGWPKAGEVKSTIGASLEFERAVTVLMTRLSLAGQGKLVTLAERLNCPSVDKLAKDIVAGLKTVALDAKRGDMERAAAARDWIAFRKQDDAAAKLVLGEVSPRTSPELASGLIQAVALSESPAIGADIARRLPGMTPGARAAAIRALLLRVEWTKALLDSLDAGQTQLADLTLDQRQALAAHRERDISTRAKKLLERGGALPNADRKAVIESLIAVTEQRGDFALGKVVFTQACAKCHRHSGEGAPIGPDLTGMAVHPKIELLTHILDPSRGVEGNFRSYTVATVDGLNFVGMLASETRTSVELIDAEAKKHVLQRADIEELAVSTKSLMPEGFEKQLSPKQLTDLLEFLTTKGKYFPLPMQKAATVVTTRGMFHEGDNGPDRLIFEDWSPKLVRGVPFHLIDPRGTAVPNGILLYGPQGTLPPSMPRSARLPCNTPAKAIHLLSGVSGWGYPIGAKGSVSMIVRLIYEDGMTEEHPLKNGEHFADYIRRVDVPGSEFAFALRGQQLRYLSVIPKRALSIREVDLVKGPDNTAPIVMAVTVETREPAEPAKSR